MNTIKSLLFAGLAGCCLMAALASCANQPTSYTINGTVEGLEDGTVVTLVPLTHAKEDPIGETTVQGGKFLLTGEATDTMVVGLIVKDSYGSGRFVLDNRNITVAGKVEKTKAWDGTDQYNWNIKVEGSPLTDRFLELYAERDKLDQLYQDYHEQYKELFEKAQQLPRDKVKEFMESDEFKPAAEAEKNFFETVDKTLNGIVLDNKDTFWGPLMATLFMSYFSSEQGELYNQFSDAAKNSYYGRKMKEEIWPVGQVGEQAKEFRVTGDDGKELTLSQLLEGKKYVLLDFWASWCGPCRKEIPNVKAQYAKYKDMGFSVIGISIDKDEKAWKKAVTEEKLEWPNFCSPAVADLYKVKAVPTVYLLDAQGNIVAEGDECRGDGLAAKLAELFAK